VQCYNCSENGHYANDCWSKRNNHPNKDQNLKSGKRQIVNLVNDPNEEEKSEVCTIRHDKREVKPKARFAVTELKEERVNLMVGGGKLLKHKICNDVEINAVIETGAYVSVVDHEIVEQLDWTLEAPVMKLVGADGKPLGLKGTTVLDLELRIKNVSKRLRHRVAVVENLPAPMLIGLELMKELQIFIDVPKLELRFMKSATKGGICTIEDEVIRSRSQVLLQAQVNMVGNILAVPLMLV